MALLLQWVHAQRAQGPDRPRARVLPPLPRLSPPSARPAHAEEPARWVGRGGPPTLQEAALEALMPASLQAEGRRPAPRYYGVSCDVDKGKWRATIQHHNHTYYGGLYDSEDEAARARDRQVIELLGKDSGCLLNFPEEWDATTGSQAVSAQATQFVGVARYVSRAGESFTCKARFGQMVYFGKYATAEAAAITYDKLVWTFAAGQQGKNRRLNFGQTYRSVPLTEEELKRFGAKVAAARQKYQAAVRASGSRTRGKPRGVHFKADSGKWSTCISQNGRRVWLGTFEDSGAAGRAYQLAVDQRRRGIKIERAKIRELLSALPAGTAASLGVPA